MRNLMKTVVALAATGGLGMSGLFVPAQATTGQPLPAVSAGALVAWGSNPEGAAAVPASLDGVPIVDVEASSLGWGAAVKSDGNVVTWGSGNRPVTSGLSNVAAVDAYGGGLVALNRDGSVSGASDPGSGLSSVPTMTSATDVAVNMAAGAAVQSGEVKVWGAYAEYMPVPTGLTDVTQVAGGILDFAAVKADGTVVGWGATPSAPVPVAAQGHVKSIAGGQVSGVSGSVFAAVLDDGTVRAWGDAGEIATPTGLDDKRVIDVDVNGSIVAVTDDGAILSWGGSAPVVESVPTFDGIPLAVSAGMNPDNSSFAFAIATQFKAVVNPAIAGAATVGQTLTASPATFSLTPDSVTTQWYASGTPIVGATSNTLKLAAANVGKQITVLQIATLASQSAVTATSAAVGPVKAAPAPPKPPVKLAPVAVKKATVKVSKSPTSRKTGKAAAKFNAGATKVNGKATVVLKKKGKKSKKFTVTVKNGKASIKLPKLAKGTWKLTVTFKGSRTVKAKTAKSVKVKVKKK